MSTVELHGTTYHSTLHSCPFLGPSRAPGIHLAQFEQFGLLAASGRWHTSLHVSQNPQFPSLRQNEQLLPRDRQDESATPIFEVVAEVDLLPLVKRLVNVLSQLPLWQIIKKNKSIHK